MLYTTEWTATVTFADGEKIKMRSKRQGTAAEIRAGMRRTIENGTYAEEYEFPFKITALKEHLYDGSH